METTLSTTAGEQGGGTYSTNKPSPAVGVVEAPAAEQMRPAPTTTAGALQFVVPFKALPGRIGVSRTRLTGFRDEKLRRGVDWELVDGVCLLTQDGALALAEAAGAFLAQKAGSDAPAEEKPGHEPSPGPDGPLPTAEGCAPEGCAGAELTAPEPKTAPVDLTVTRLTMNGRILLATDGRGATYRVRVKDATKFVPRMVIPCRHVAADVYELAVRMPRQKGKW